MFFAYSLADKLSVVDTDGVEPMITVLEDRLVLKNII